MHCLETRFRFHWPIPRKRIRRLGANQVRGTEPRSTVPRAYFRAARSSDPKQASRETDLSAPKRHNSTLGLPTPTRRPPDLTTETSNFDTVRRNFDFFDLQSGVLLRCASLPSPVRSFTVARWAPGTAEGLPINLARRSGWSNDKKARGKSMAKKTA